MKKPVLALLALLFSFTQSMAQPVENLAMASAPDTTAEFLATLSDGQPQISDDQVPVPLFMTGCNSQCVTGEICCYLCGNPPAEGDDSFCRGCVTPVKGRCPMVV